MSPLSLTGQALEVLRTGVESYAPFLGADGELRDPVFGVPTQYGTPYYALGSAVLARHGPEAERARFQERADRAARAALRHLLHHLPACASSFDRATGAAGHVNHRDFFWPAIVASYEILGELREGAEGGTREAVSSVRVPEPFASRPPSNWAAVWISGEFARMRLSLSSTTLDQLDQWLGAFFDNRILPDRGLYLEPGQPNSYDLFTRYHLATLLDGGYAGRWRQEMEELFRNGLRRSLAVQLSDGSLASAHRSTGQTWTVGAQCAHFALATRLVDDPDLRKAAWRGAARAFSSFRRWQRRGGTYSPVENLLPPSWRVGYEPYTADGHYGNLALGFLARAVLHGLPDSGADLGARAAAVLVEGDPIQRAVAHCGPYSVHGNGCPAPGYDGYGIVDLTFGEGRHLQFVSSARHMGTGGFFNIGTAHRTAAGLAPLEVVAQSDIIPVGSPEPVGRSGFRLVGRPRGRAYQHLIEAEAHQDGVHIEERTPGERSYRTLLLPYLRDGGGGVTTEVRVVPGGLHFAHGEELVEVRIGSPVEHMVHLPHGYENRRGLCGLVRVDLEGEIEGVRTDWRIVR